MTTTHKNQISRKTFLRTGLGVAGAALTGSALAQQICTETTAPQPLGPFFPNANTPVDPIREDSDPNVPIHLANDSNLTFVNGRQGTAEGRLVHLTGKVTDSDCRPISGASIVIWQASKSGRYNHQGDDDNLSFRHPVTGEVMRRELDPFFQYWGRALSAGDGTYQFKTVVPGFYPADLSSGWYRPPHIHFLVSATGYQQLTTQLYFNIPDDPDNEWTQALNSRDRLLQSSEISDAERNRLIVTFAPEDGWLLGSFDLVLKR